MLQLLITLLFAVIIFWAMWVPLGARELVADLLRDEKTELQAQLDQAEDSLAELAEDEHPDETTAMLREHYEKEARQLRRKLTRVNQGSRPLKERS